MTNRSPDDYKHELQTLDQVHTQNESARDSFVAIAHTALFAASVSFVGSAVPLPKAIWCSALVVGWAADVVGLLSLTASFVVARHEIDARRNALNDENAPHSGFADVLNAIALWSFPVGLLCLFSFLTANVVHINERRQDTAATSASQAGDSAASASPELCRRRQPANRSGSTAAGTNGPPAATHPIKEVNAAAG